LNPFFDTLLVVGLAELGDKTQLLTFGLATRYSFWSVISAVSVATGLLMAMAVIFGEIINRFIPDFYILLLAGLFFLGFGLYTIFSRDETVATGAIGGKNPFIIIFAGFFLAELGDKSQLATLAFSAEYGAPLLVWLGATLGMIGVNCLSGTSWSSMDKISWCGSFSLFWSVHAVKALLPISAKYT
jgi:putative Ca2+/H+ antiporter (TMEM165/GDT1 family)